jgi:hypothetical protein
VLSSDVKRAKPEADRSPPSIAKLECVKMYVDSIVLLSLIILTYADGKIYRLKHSRVNTN